jgi:(1->4)-alpha-D-glucan 1-alpha-D-glucosylmutase
VYQGHEVINLSLLRDGDYLPLEIHGGHAAHVVAFARRHQGATLVVIAGRLFARLLGELTLAPLGPAVWADTAVAIDVPDGVQLTGVFTGKTLIVRHGRVAVGAAFLHLPVAALMSYSG